jgi:hypothetical protein
MDATQLLLTEQICFELPVSLITAKIVKVVAARESCAEMKSFMVKAESAMSQMQFAEVTWWTN